MEKNIVDFSAEAAKLHRDFTDMQDEVAKRKNRIFFWFAVGVSAVVSAVLGGLTLLVLPHNEVPFSVLVACSCIYLLGGTTFWYMLLHDIWPPHLIDVITNSWFQNYCQAPLHSFRQSFTVSELAVFMVERYPHLIDITADLQLHLEKQNSLEKTISEKNQAHADALQKRLKPLQDEISALTSKHQEEKAKDLQPFYEDLTTVKKEIGVFQIFEACKPK